MDIGIVRIQGIQKMISDVDLAVGNTVIDITIIKKVD